MNKIPEGATHTAPDKTYRKIAGKDWFACADGDWILIDGAAARHYTPIQAEPEWTGEGRPPVGSVCEVQEPKGLEEGDWSTCEVLAWDGSCAVFKIISGTYPSAYDALCSNAFRPIRTPEQIAAEKRLHNILNACTDISKTLDRFKNDIPGGGAARAVIEAMIDAGYSKRVEK